MMFTTLILYAVSSASAAGTEPAAADVEAFRDPPPTIALGAGAFVGYGFGGDVVARVWLGDYVTVEAQATFLREYRENSWYVVPGGFVAARYPALSQSPHGAIVGFGLGAGVDLQTGVAALIGGGRLGYEYAGNPWQLRATLIGPSLVPGVQELLVEGSARKPVTVFVPIPIGLSVTVSWGVM